MDPQKWNFSNPFETYYHKMVPIYIRVLIPDFQFKYPGTRFRPLIVFQNQGINLPTSGNNVKKLKISH